MTIEKTYTILASKQKRSFLIVACLLLLTCTTIALDLLYASMHGSSFYLSESLLFSTFWLLFFPILTFQVKLTQQCRSLTVGILITVTAICVHLLAYPAFVWLLSGFFYYHTFSYWQTFNFGLTEHLTEAATIYSLYYLFITLYTNKFQSKPLIAEQRKDSKENYLSSILVSESKSKKIPIATTDIIYFSANPPYINIHHKTKKYLLTETLKSLEAKLDNKTFIRIHKSYIVNIDYVISYQSRQNGDYDLKLSDQTVLRVSRNYASGFKNTFSKGYRVTPK